MWKWIESRYVLTDMFNVIDSALSNTVLWKITELDDKTLYFFGDAIKITIHRYGRLNLECPKIPINIFQKRYIKSKLYSISNSRLMTKIYNEVQGVIEEESNYETAKSFVDDFKENLDSVIDQGKKLFKEFENIKNMVHENNAHVLLEIDRIEARVSHALAVAQNKPKDRVTYEMSDVMRVRIERIELVLKEHEENFKELIIVEDE